MGYVDMVEKIRDYEPFSDCSYGQFEACDHLGLEAVQMPEIYSLVNDLAIWLKD